MKKRVLFSVFLASALCSCKIGGTATITVEAETCTNGTISLNKEQLECGEVLTITAQPDEGYLLSKISPENVYEDIDDKLKFYWIASKPDNAEENYVQKISANFVKENEPVSYQVSKSIPQGSGVIEISGGKDTFYEGDTVTFTLTITNGYQLLTDGVYVKTEKNDILELTENEDGSYSFEMPHRNVMIYVRLVEGVYLNVDKFLYIQESSVNNLYTITIPVVNTTKYTVFDAYYGPELTRESDAVLCGSDLEIRNGVVALTSDGMEIGTYYLWLKNDLSIKSNKVKFRVGYKDCDSAWVSVKIKEKTVTDNKVQIKLNESIPRAYVKYRYSDDSSENLDRVLILQNRGTLFNLEFEQKSVARDVTFVINDTVLKIQSDKNTVTLPAAAE